ncbi:MAG: NADH oxidase, partial [Bdellovibrionota bacterium]
MKLPCGFELRNRIAKSAMSEALGTTTHLPSLSLVEVYRRWAESGAGLLITGNAMVDRTALGEPDNVVIEAEAGRDTRAFERFQEWARAGQSQGVPVWVQLNHPGRESPRNLSPVPV